MTTSDSRTQVSELILEEACQWFIDFNEGELGPAGHEAFNSWLRRSPEHVRAYLEIAVAWADSSKLKGQGFESGALVVATLAESNVVPLTKSDYAATAGRDFSFGLQPPGLPSVGDGRLPGSRHAPVSSAARPRALRRAIVEGALLAVAVSALLAVGIALLSQRNAYVTHIGEQRSFVLEDGSAVELDALSRVRVRFSHAERTVELIDGQALFQVRKDSARPFIVLANGIRVRAVGTQFDVYRKATRTIVTVIDGRIAVTAPVLTRSGGSPEAGGAVRASSPIFLSAGEQVTVSPSGAPEVVRADLAAATAWRERKLVFDEIPLSEVAAEFNRYNARQLMIEDASLADYHIRGHFEATDPDPLIQFLRERFGAEVRENGNEIHISRR